MKPVIGITPAYDLERGYGYIKSGYYKAVQKAGGIPFILPEAAEGEYLTDLVDACDGFIFTGGQDFGDKYYGEPPNVKNGRASSARDELEFALMEKVIEKDKPVLGICRGMQLMTLVLGGRLWQNIPKHDNPPYNKASHWVIIEKGSELFGVINKERVFVNSCHHQAVRECGRGQRVMAYASDGMIEAAYIPEKRFAWGVQWHPELMQEEADAMKIFEKLVKVSEK